MYPHYKNMKTDSELTILVLSSDPYQPILRVWERYFKKHWPDCPYKVKAVCNHTHFKSDLINWVVTNHFIRDDASHFKPMLARALEKKKIDTKYILLMVEDQILVKDVITDNFKQAMSYMDENDITKMRCLSMPSPDEPLDVEKGIINNDNFGFISKDNEYRNSLQAAIWNTERFFELLVSVREDFSGWVLETGEHFRDYSKKWKYMSCKHGKGGTFLDRYEGMGDSPLMNYVELVRWGKFDALYIDYFREMFKKDGFSVDSTAYINFGAGLSKEELPQ